MKAGISSNNDQMSHDGGANSLALMAVDDCKGDLGLSGLKADIAPGTHEVLLPAFFRERDQSHVPVEIDIEKELALLLRKFALKREKTEVAGPGTDLPDCGHE